MYSYTAYGLSMWSAFALPELLESPSGSAVPCAPDVSVAFAPVDRARPRGVAEDAPVWATPRVAFLDYPGAGAFLIRDGRQIVIDPLPGADPRIIRLFLLGPALALLLHQRGFLVLHASAVRIGGGAVAFVGDKGMGKSTMAAALHARGHVLVADDVVAVDTAGGRSLAHPGFPQLKLFPESAALLDANPDSLPKIHPDFEKRARPALERFASDPLPLTHVFVLDNGEREAIEPAGRQQGFMELVRHSYLLELLSATGSSAAHFHQAAALAGRMPVLRLLRRRSLDLLADVARLVEEEVCL